MNESMGGAGKPAPFLIWYPPEKYQPGTVISGFPDENHLREKAGPVI
jgi:hypothetical protein